MIKCYIDNKRKIALMEGDEGDLCYKSFSNVNFADEVEILDTFANILQVINRVSIDLKIHKEAKTSEDVLFIVDCKEFIEFIKPNGELLNKVTKALKKQITNNNLKLNLGCALAELNKMFKVDIVYGDIPEINISTLKEFDEIVASNKPKIDTEEVKEEVKEETNEKIKEEIDNRESKNNNATIVDGKINLELDFFPSNDIINLPDAKVLETNENSNTSTNEDANISDDNDDNDANINDNEDIKINDEESTSLKETLSTDSLKSSIESEIKYLKSNIENNTKLYKNKLNSALSEYNNLKKRLDDFSMNEEEELELLKQIKNARLKIRQSETLYNIYSNLEIAMNNELSKFY